MAGGWRCGLHTRAITSILALFLLCRCGSAAPRPCAAPWMQPKAALEAPDQQFQRHGIPAEAGEPQSKLQLAAGARSSLLRLQKLAHVPLLGAQRVQGAGPGASSSRRSSSSTTTTTVRRKRQLLHLDSLDAVDTADSSDASAAAMMYPREAAAVQRYLKDAMRSTEGPLEVPVWFVVVTDPKSPAGTNITQAQVQAQVQLLNRAYATGLPPADHAGDMARQLWRFRLIGVRYVGSDAPMCMGSAADDRIKRQLHPQLVAAAADAGFHAAHRTLVVYTTDLTSSTCRGSVPGYKALFGWSNTPMELAAWRQRQEDYKDGVVLDWRYLLASDRTQAEAGSKAMHGASTGAQLVHEVGHFMGLLHTFVGGCSTSAAATDAVDDTPAEAHPRMWGVDLGDASGGCSPRDTCPGLPGEDPWDNYMNYNNLACARRFTPGQQARMVYAWLMLRSTTR